MLGSALPSTPAATSVKFNHVPGQMRCAVTAKEQNQSGKVLGLANAAGRLCIKEGIEIFLDAEIRHAGGEDTAIEQNIW